MNTTQVTVTAPTGLRARIEAVDVRRWSHVCGDCWYDALPDVYLPERPLTFDACYVCGVEALVYGIRTRLLEDPR